MFKFLVLSVLLCQEIYKIAGQTQGKLTDTPISPVPSNAFNDCNKIIGDPDGNTYNAAYQTFYMNGTFVVNCPAGTNCNVNIGHKEIRGDYNISKGIGGHKVHLRKVTWNKARRICHEEGGHLAIIRSEAEEWVIQEMMRQASIESAWLGFHDQFEEGEWLTVLDEPLAEVGWDAWAKNIGHVNPDNFNGGQNCAWYMRNFSGIDDNYCHHQHAFVCKISIT